MKTVTLKDIKAPKIRILNLGCNQRAAKAEGNHVEVTNVDLEHYPGVNVACDLNEIPWPFESDHYDRVVGYDVIEHLQSPICTMNEIWRVLKPGGVADILVPSTDGRGAWQDPTHVFNPVTRTTGSYWNQNSFPYYSMVPSNPENPKSNWISHPWRGLYPSMIKAAFMSDVTTMDPTQEGIVYVKALLYKLVPDDQGKVDASQLPEGQSD